MESGAINQWLTVASSFLCLSSLVLKCRGSPALTKQSISHQQYQAALHSGNLFSLSLSSAANQLLRRSRLFLNLWVEEIKQGGGAYSVVQAGDHGVRHPGAEPGAGCAHCDWIADAGQLPATCRSKSRKCDDTNTKMTRKKSTVMQMSLF